MDRGISDEQQYHETGSEIYVVKLRHQTRFSIRSMVEKWRWATFPVVVFLVTRAALMSFSYISLTLVPELWQNYRARSYLQRFPALDGLCRFDCEWFEAIAGQGYYSATTTNFFPLFPLLGRAVNRLTGIHILISLLLIANIACLAAYIIIYHLFTKMADEQTAKWALTILVAYPFAYFHAAAYPESLMLLFSALAVLLALRGNHIWAGVALGLGVLSRHITMFAGAALLAAQVHQRGFHPRRLLLHPAILGLLVPWLFFGMYCYFQYVAFGNPLAFSEARDAWGPRSWWGIATLLRTSERDLDVQIMFTFLPFALLPTIGAIALVTKREWVELASFAVVLLLVLWLIGIWGIGRYSASCWPAFLPIGKWVASRPNMQGPLIVVLALFQGLFFFLYSHQFPIL